MNQCQMILIHLHIYGGITAKEAEELYGVMGLASRISDLRKAGIPIECEIVRGVNRFGEKVHYAKYVLGRNKKC